LRNIDGLVGIDPADCLRRALKTACEMLRDRGYVHVRAERDAACDIVAAIAKGRAVASARTPKGGEELHGDAAECDDGDTASCSVAVVFTLDERVGVKQLRQHCESFDADLIVVSPQGPTHFTAKEAERERGARVQFFTYRELANNVTKHHLVPAHRRVSATTLPAGIRPCDLPRLPANDRVARHFGFTVGDIIEIRRVFGHAEPHVYYRAVCAPIATGLR